MSDLSVKVDFVVLDTVDNTIIMVGDKSQWGVAENQPAYLLVKPPGSNTFININFIKHNLMFLTSVNLGLSCVTLDCTGTQNPQELPDGVWEFCLKSGYEGLDKSRYYLKTDSLRIELDKIYLREGIEYNPNSQVVKSLEKIEWLLVVAEAAIRDGDNIKAMKAFNMASDFTGKYKNYKDCI